MLMKITKCILVLCLVLPKTAVTTQRSQEVYINPHLPELIKKDLDSLIVKRHGNNQTSYLKTKSIFGYVEPGITYKVTPKGLVAVDDFLDEAKLIVQTTKAPPHVKIMGKWDKQIRIDGNEGNILGGYGSLIIDDTHLEIPGIISSQSALQFYGAHLVKHGDMIKLKTPHALPQTIMEIGERYVEDYILQPNRGGGAYLEYHNTPHFHMPLNYNSSGFLILAKKIDNNFIMTGFQIPYGYAILTPAGVIHDDAYLVGEYLVIYAVAQEFSTVLLRDKHNKLLNVSIQNPSH